MGCTSAVLSNLGLSPGEPVLDTLARTSAERVAPLNPEQNQYSDVRVNWNSWPRACTLVPGYLAHFMHSAMDLGLHCVDIVAHSVLDANDKAPPYLIRAVVHALYNLLEIVSSMPSKRKRCKNGRTGLSVMLRITLFLWYLGRSRHILQKCWE